jgi:tetratricopeptide (TPR) repeat protein
MNIPVQWRAILIGCMPALFILEPSAPAFAQVVPPAQTFSQVDTLGLPPATASQLKTSLEAHDYIAAEKRLLAEINRDPHSSEAARLLQFLGGVYFLDHDAWGAAVAWNKAKTIAPLPPAVAFSLVMAYIRIGHSDWARKELETLTRENGENALYPYWLGRLDYDADQYDHAILRFQKAIQLSPDMAQAYNNLGLCYFRQNHKRLAVVNYQKAIDLNLKSGHLDAWPYLNLAITERSLNRQSDAERHLHEAIRLDPHLAVAYFQLGNILEESGKTKDAIGQFQAAARTDPDYAEPHYALAHIYQKLGDAADAKREIQSYLKIHSLSRSPVSRSPTPSYPDP